MQLYIDSFVAMRSVSLISAGGPQNQAGWRRLAAALGGALAREEVDRNPLGLGLLGAGALCVAVIVWTIAQNPHAVVSSLLEIARSLLNWRP